MDARCTYRYKWGIERSYPPPRSESLGSVLPVYLTPAEQMPLFTYSFLSPLQASFSQNERLLLAGDSSSEVTKGEDAGLQSILF